MSTNKLSIAIASAALVVAALGTTPLGHAAAQLILPKASVGTAQLKAGAVTGLKVKDGSLAAADFAAGQLPAGPKGDRGEKGETGDPGAPGMSGYEIVKGTIANIGGGGTHLAELACPSDKRAIGAGFTGGLNEGMATIFSFPYNGGASWYLRVRNLSASATNFQGNVICVSVG